MPQEKIFGCALCTFGTDVVADLKNHLKEFHPKEFGHFCKHCAQCYRTIDQLIEHMKNDCRRENIYVFRCAEGSCGFICNKPPEFSAHIKMIHKGRPLMNCVYCNQYFTIPFCLVQHIQETCENRPIDWTKEEATYGATRNLAPKILNMHTPASRQPSSSTNSRTIAAPKTAQLATRSTAPAVIKNTNIRNSSSPPKRKTTPLPKEKVKQPPVPQKLFNAKLNNAEGLFGSSSDSDIDDPAWGSDNDDDSEDERPKTKRVQKRASPMAATRKLPERSRRGKKIKYNHSDEDHEDDDDENSSRPTRANNRNSKKASPSGGEKKMLTSFEDRIKIEVEDDSYEDNENVPIVKNDSQIKKETDVKLTTMQPRVVLKRQILKV